MCYVHQPLFRIHVCVHVLIFFQNDQTSGEYWLGKRSRCPNENGRNLLHMGNKSNSDKLTTTIIGLTNMVKHL